MQESERAAITAGGEEDEQVPAQCVTCSHFPINIFSL